MIDVKNLTVAFGDTVALQDLSLHIEPGAFALISGPSGCGKSTLARTLAGLISHTSPARMQGHVHVAGLDTRQTPLAVLAQHVGLVFQNPNTQLFNLTVEEEVAFGPQNLGLLSEEVVRRVSRALMAVGISHLHLRGLDTLSIGEKQRVAIAAVLAMEPDVLVLDEPTSSLDVRGTQEVLRTLARINRKRGTTVVVMEHKIGQLARLADRTILLDRGRVAADGPTEEVLARRVLLRELGVRRPSSNPQADWAHLIKPNGSQQAGAPLVELAGVEAGYGSHTVLRDLNLTLHHGEFAALVGDNGAGKSTLARLLAGLVKPRRGSVRLLQQQGAPLGLLFQNPLDQLFCDTVEQEVTFGARNLLADWQPAVDDALTATDLARLRKRRMHHLSGGEQQRAALAALLALRPRLLILDEPTMGQDWGHLTRFMACAQTLNRAGTTVLLITHDYKLVHHYSHRVILLRGGRIVADGAPRNGVRPPGRAD